MLVSIIKELESNNSSTFKKEVLEKYKEDETLKEFLKMTYDTSINYYVSSKKLAIESSAFPISIQEQQCRVRDALVSLSSKSIRLGVLMNMLDGELDRDHIDLFKRVLDGNIAKGVSVKSINSVFGQNFIQEFSYMRCSGIEEVSNISYPAYAQLKSDGAFYNIILNKEENSVKFLSRNGKELKSEYLSEVFSPLLNHIGVSIVINGEMLVLKDDKILPREAGNGMISSLAQREASRVTMQDKIGASTSSKKANDNARLQLTQKEDEWNDIEESIIVKAWDMILLENWLKGETFKVPYKTRLDALKVLVSRLLSHKFQITDSWEVKSVEEAQTIYDNLVAKGEEGIVLKNMDMPWENKTSKNQIKFKEKKQCELKVVGWNPGEGDFKDGIGSLICESSDGKIKVNISGMKRHQRGLIPVDSTDMSKGLKRMEYFDLDYYTGRIITVEFNGVITKKGNDIMSLFLPVIVEVRDDKDVADDSDYIIKL